ncbi:nucleoside monophosphate kinase [Mycoplasma sp. Mirounga ES2805-ORL]|uniref:adenylate kinase family protein n=1 Tax=Mycoplasma sp. Mirounga ES2805-ORL TaxID=754514 RepID=UPI00197B94CE|nr:nucleoside monophosphate kinase [Mycoplasma sp. Mirounga ES2805-ORL]QSF13902.1 nucleoside monophosphate kinase [Mycoplasma sp. Mirounga ES2805-ORL]
MIENKNINIVFLGSPGVGKGTVAGNIADNENIIHLSTGSIFRAEIASQSELGKKISAIVSSGKYVTDEITNEIVRKKLIELNKENKSVILDGYPRTLDQAEFLDSLDFFKYRVIELVAPEDLIMKRLNGRRSCPKCKKGFHIEFMPSKNGERCDNCNTKLITRADDSIESIKVRMSVYNEQTKPLLDYYKNKNNLTVFDASGKVEDIASNIKDKLGIK